MQELVERPIRDIQAGKTTADFDAEIEEAEKHLIVLKRQRNATRPLCELPPKLLEVVLLAFLPAQDTTYGPYDIKATSNAEWMSLMRVCSRLREVALSSQLLWARVEADHGNRYSAWLSLCVSHSQENLLFGRVSGELRVNQEKLLDLACISHRLRLWVPPSANVQEAQKCLIKVFDILGDSAQLPRLTSLELYDATDRPNGHLRLPPRFLGENTIHLTELFLDNISTADVPNMPSLGRLRMRRICLSQYCSSLRQMLIHAPNITVLRLEYPTSETADTVVNVKAEQHVLSTTAPVKLGELHTVKVIGSFTKVGLALYVIPNPGHLLSFRMDEKWDVDQTVMNIKLYYGDLAQYAQQRMVSYVRDAFQLGKLARHQIQAQITPDINGTVASITMFPLARLDDRRRGVDFDIIAAPGSCLDDLTCYSDDVEVIGVSRDSPLAMKRLFPARRICS